MESVTLFLIILIAFIAIVIWKGVQLVQEGDVLIVERLGQYYKTLRPGIHVTIPGFDRVRSVTWKYTSYQPDGTYTYEIKTTKKIDMRERVLDFPRQNVITKDNVLTEINALLFYQIMDPVKAIYEIENLPEAIEKLAQTSLRSLIGEMSLDETLFSRDKINNSLQKILDDATDKWGVKVNRVELQDINPPGDIHEAMEQEMRAERKRRAKVTEAEGVKRAAILESEGAQEAFLNRAKGEKAAKELIADADAYARMRSAQAEAEAIKRIASAVNGSTSDPVQYLIATRYIESMQEMATSDNNKIIYMPYEASGLIGSLGPLKELFEKDKPEPPNA